MQRIASKSPAPVAGTRSWSIRTAVSFFALVLGMAVASPIAGAESSDYVAGDHERVLADLAAANLSPRVVPNGGIVATFETDVPSAARVVVDDVLAEFDRVFMFPKGSIQVAVGWADMTSLGLGGPVLVRRAGTYYPAALADVRFGGQHASGTSDGFVSMSSDQPWYFGDSATVPAASYDFRTAFTHELVHALGFTVDTTVDRSGRTVLSGRTPQMDRNLYSAGRALTTLSATAQSRAFATDDVWLDVGGGRLYPIHADGTTGVSHFGNAISPVDSEPGALMYAGLINGARHSLDAPVVGAMVRLGYSASTPVVAPSHARFDGATVRWNVDMRSPAAPPETVTVRVYNDGRLLHTAVVPGAAQQVTLPRAARAGAIEISATSMSGVTAVAHVGNGGSFMANATTVAQFVTADDYRDEYGAVLRLYVAFFSRQPDVGGAKYWVSIFSAGSSLDAIASAFAGSGEFVARYGRLTNTEYLEVIYRNVLGRERDDGGFNYWLGLLSSNRLSRGQVVRWIASAPEFVNANRY